VVSHSGDGEFLRVHHPRSPFGPKQCPPHLRQARQRGRDCATGGTTASPHDLRHSFTVATLLDFYRDGGDVQARLPILSTWLGHVDPKSTYWYLHAIPELLALAADRLEAVFGEQP
jgi:integrase